MHASAHLLHWGRAAAVPSTGLRLCQLQRSRHRRTTAQEPIVFITYPDGAMACTTGATALGTNARGPLQGVALVWPGTGQATPRPGQMRGHHAQRGVPRSTVSECTWRMQKRLHEKRLMHHLHSPSSSTNQRHSHCKRRKNKARAWAQCQLDARPIARGLSEAAALNGQVNQASPSGRPYALARHLHMRYNARRGAFQEGVGHAVREFEQGRAGL